MTEPIQNQGSEGTCYAYAVSRCFNRFLRELGIALVPEVHQIVLDWAKKEFGIKGANPLLVMQSLINKERNAPSERVLPEDLRPHLFLRSVNISFGDKSSETISKSGNIETIEYVSCDGRLHPILIDAIRDHRSPVCTFYMRQNQFNAFTRNADWTIKPDHIPQGDIHDVLRSFCCFVSSGRKFWCNIFQKFLGR